MLIQIDGDGQPVRTGGTTTVRFPSNEPPDLYQTGLYTVAGTAGTRTLTRQGQLIGREWVEAPAPRPANQHALRTGQSVMERLFINASNITSATGFFRLAFFRPTSDLLVSRVQATTGGTQAAATPTLCRLGVYSVDESTDAGTLIGSTPNDTTLFAATHTVYTKSLSSAVQVRGGGRYAIGLLVVSGAATPTFTGYAGITSAAGATAILATAPRLSASLSSQTDLPATFTDASLSVSNNMPYFTILP